MDKKMFCYQCEQTLSCSGCTGMAGVCGKTQKTANLQDKLTGKLIKLAEICEKTGRTDNSDKLILEGLFSTLTNVNFNDQRLVEIIELVDAEINKKFLTCKKNETNNIDLSEYDMKNLWNEEDDIRSLKSLILFGIKGIAAYTYHSYALGYKNEEINNFIYKALPLIGAKMRIDDLLPVVMETGKINYLCMELLDKANTETFGIPEPTNVS